MLDGLLDDILQPSTDRGEFRPDSPAIRPAESLDITGFSPHSPNSPGLNALDDDRHYCRECLHLNSRGYCTQQRFRPVDDIPRRCEDFSDYPAEIGNSDGGECPSREAAHNAQSRFFKFLITRQDGTQFDSCSMPRLTIEEVRAQFPDAANIEPVENEDYDDDNE
jgi:hypothetical protein